MNVNLYTIKMVTIYKKKGTLERESGEGEDNKNVVVVVVVVI